MLTDRQVLGSLWNLEMSLGEETSRQTGRRDLLRWIARGFEDR